MAQVTLCDHCGQEIDATTQPFAHAEFNASAGGGGGLDYHNSTTQPCFFSAYEAVKTVSAFPDRYPDIAIAPAGPAS